MIDNKVVLVTGSSRGIGKAIALAFGKKDFKVIVNYLTNNISASEVVNQIKKMGANSMQIWGDVSDSNSVDNMIQRTVEEFGRIDVLINNAGIHDDNVLWNMSDEAWNRVVSVNLTGTFNCMRAAIKYMRKQNYGRIVNISSVVGQVGISGTSNYSASKSGIFGLTKTVAREVARKEITVNVLALGYFNSGMFNRLSKPIQEQIIQQIPMKRIGTMQEVVDTVLFLCSKSAGYITGQIIHLNGGYYM